jgi:hypothetical protein
MNLQNGTMKISAKADALTEDSLVARRGRFRSWAVVVVVAILWSLPILALHRASPRTLASAHGLLHAAVSQRFVESGSVAIPPENPFFAGRPVTYYWFFHFAGASLTALFDLDPLHAFEALIVASMVGLVIWSAILGRALFGRPLAGLMIGYLALAGTNSLGPVALLGRFIRHGTIVFQDNPHHLWGIAHPIFSLARVGDPWGLYGPLINFYLNITSRPVALSLLIAVLLFLYWALRNRSRAPLIGLSLTTALCTMFSPLIGLAAGASLLGGLTASWMWDRLRFQKGQQLESIWGGSRLAAGAAIGLGLILALPTFYHMFSLAGGGVEFFAGSIGRLWTVLLSGHLLLLLAGYGTWRCSMDRDRRRFFVAVLAAALLLLSANIAVSIPPGNESNLFHAAVFLLAVPASASIFIPQTWGTPGELRVSLRRAGALVLIFLPAPVIVLASYMGRPPLPLGFEGSTLVRLPVESNLSRLYRWTRGNTPKEAIFVIDPRKPVVKMGGNVSEFPALTGRVIFTDSPTSYMVDRYQDAQFRFRMAVRLVSGDSLDQSEKAYLDELKRPIYVVVRNANDRLRYQRVVALYGPAAFEQGDVGVFQWQTVLQR